jgi:hypothetical protein
MNQHGVSDRNSEFLYESLLTYKKQYIYTCSRNTKESWCNYSTAICRHWVTQRNKSMRSSNSNYCSNSAPRQENKSMQINQTDKDTAVIGCFWPILGMNLPWLAGTAIEPLRWTSIGEHVCSPCAMMMGALLKPKLDRCVCNLGTSQQTGCTYAVRCLDWRIVGIPPNPGNPSFPNPGPKLGDDKSASFRLPQGSDFFPKSTRSTSMRTKVRGLKKPRGNSVREDVSFYKNGGFQC